MHRGRLAGTWTTEKLSCHLLQLQRWPWFWARAQLTCDPWPSGNCTCIGVQTLMPVRACIAAAIRVTDFCMSFTAA